MNIEELDLKKAKEIIINWAKNDPFIAKVYLFGSRISGISKDGKPVRLDSDLDIAIEFTPMPGDSDFLTTWVCERDKWHRELLTLLGFAKKEHLDLQRHHQTETPHMATYIEQNSMIIYSADHIKET